MPGPLVPDELWEAIQPLLPRHKAKPGQRKQIMEAAIKVVKGRSNVAKGRSNARKRGHR